MTRGWQQMPRAKRYNHDTTTFVAGNVVKKEKKLRINFREKEVNGDDCDPRRNRAGCSAVRVSE
jgi:hypothetical protein